MYSSCCKPQFLQAKAFARISFEFTVWSVRTCSLLQALYLNAHFRKPSHPSYAMTLKATFHSFISMILKATFYKLYLRDSDLVSHFLSQALSVTL